MPEKPLAIQAIELFSFGRISHCFVTSRCSTGSAEVPIQAAFTSNANSIEENFRQLLRGQVPQL